jgi:hypothetical protein
MASWAAADLPVAIYVNERLVFDLLATFEDGLMQVRTETVQSAGEEAHGDSVEGSAGTSGLLTFITLGFKGTANRATKRSGTQQDAGQRTHTPVSLFANLRLHLEYEELLKEVTPESFDTLENGDFVQFPAVLQRNPFVNTLLRYRTSDGRITRVASLSVRR